MAEEAMTEILPGVIVPVSRAVEWFRGTRPLDDMDPGFFFKAQVMCGMATQEQVLELHQRHLRLTRLEQAQAAGRACEACHGAPPSGYTCNACGTTSP